MSKSPKSKDLRRSMSLKGITSTTDLDHHLTVEGKNLTEGKKMSHNKVDRDRGIKTRNTKINKDKVKESKRKTKNIRNKDARTLLIGVTLDLHLDKRTGTDINRKINNIGKSRAMM